MFYDDLPIWGFIGKVEKIMSQATKSWEKHELKYYLFTHIHFDILYNGDRVIEVNVSTDPSRTVEITEGENVIVDWTYSVKWRETSIPYEKRMDKYSRYSFLPQHLEVTPVLTYPCCLFSCITSFTFYRWVCIAGLTALFVPAAAPGGYWLCSLIAATF